MEYENLLELIKTVSNSNLTKFVYEVGEMKVHMLLGEVSPKGVKESQEDITEKREKDCWFVKSPLVGRFYNSLDGDEMPLVSIGDLVKKGQIVAIVEAMKLMNEIESEYDGVITQILVESGEEVEYGQPLFQITVNKKEQKLC